MKKVAFFDFDGTITNSDSMLELIRYYKGTIGLWLGLLRVSPFIAGMKLNMLKNQVGKEKLLTYFFKGMKAEDFESLCMSFSRERLPGLIRPGMENKIRSYIKSGVQVVIVTASASQWVKYWATENGCDLIASKMEVREGVMTGKLAGRNCNFEEKVTRIKEKFDLSVFSEIYVYGDSSGDKAMLKLATHPFYKKFD
ncbi:MAG TPA: HAD-IB family hydrolase [Ginsengibacter sp.]|nr:HAD-IB family hydrolase [Chitinophagaceae bacterium]HRN73073.1 HAD-IB family hydrolase [Ginsengibacter sp.]HRP18452.1 HAD-IB family hydrolase [Ginsengibacter sp.]HRP44543.1 HAD-IB family hydrolase [Ginsengibacter sp.]